MASFWERVRAAMETFQTYDRVEPVIDQSGRYSLLYAFWEGSWRRDPRIWQQRRDKPPVYGETRELWRHAGAVVDLYAHLVYPGDLSTDAEPLPDGTRGAIPIDAQTGSDATDEALRRAFAELWSIWRYKQHKSLRPKFGAILGDCLTELVEDFDRGVVLPEIVWPGYVVDMQLDRVGNVTAYTLEYDVEVEASERYGRPVEADRYRFRKEVDREATRYFRDDRPDDRYGVGGVVANIYGFVPAIWDRHEIVFGPRGLSAIEKTMQAALEINSVLSHAMDYQARQYAAPVGVVGSRIGARDDEPVKMPRLPGRTVADVEIEEERRIAEALNLLPMSKDGRFVTVELNLGQTKELLQEVKDSIIAENPEAKFDQQLLEMRTLTAPGAERAMGRIISKVVAARDNYDPQTIKQMQMATTMMAVSLARGDFAPEVVERRASRYEPFRAFDLGSYDRGEMDCSIPSRDVIPRTEEERVALAVLIESLKTEVGRTRAGLSEEERTALADEAQARLDRIDAEMAGFRSTAAMERGQRSTPAERAGATE